MTGIDKFEFSCWAVARQGKISPGPWEKQVTEPQWLNADGSVARVRISRVYQARTSSGARKLLVYPGEARRSDYHLTQAGLQHLKNVSGFKLDTYESAKTLWHYIFARSNG
jgi:hypothetical protein